MKASDVMRTSVATVTPGTRLIDAARLLLETNQRALPVVDRDGKLVGIISEGDFLNRVELDVDPPQRWLDTLFNKNAAGAARNHSLFVGRAMTPEPACVNSDDPLDDVIALMNMHRVAQIPVVEGGSVVGLVSRLELVAAVERRLSKTEGAATTSSTLANHEKA